MIILVALDLQVLVVQEKSYSWKRPYCHKCNSPCIGHGFVRRFFNLLDRAIVFIKRWRCKFCKIIITMRPENHWRRYQENIDQIWQALKFRMINLTWPPWTTRQRGGHWLRKLLNKAKANLLEKDTLIETINFFQDKKLAIF
jgi:hypothetical protein